MSNESQQDQIRSLIEANFDWKPASALLGPYGLPFDVSRPNIHDSKSEFLLERDTVQAVVDHLGSVISLLVKSEGEETPEHNDMTLRLGVAVSRNAIQFIQKSWPQSASDLARKNVVDAGFHHTSLKVILLMLSAYQRRLSELDEQETEFWTVKHRPPNYYARTIALRFARFYARETQTKPTFGTSREGPFPSTKYGRLLEEIFNILEIKANIRGAAEWAIPQINNEDMKPQAMGLFGLGAGLLGPMGNN